ncbi:AAA family ATPase [Brachyspira hyodysenteriae]|uniref:AAA family ATPase n=3 Tax=Brachyspira hyodysenteriae TaxID=159 RepID=UPI0022CDE3CF|nr:AAA family ATPase [Brachyspira hyodysenteriae]MDA0023072.1 KAP family NTPase [Brachyspira hyodysenteriae]
MGCGKTYFIKKIFEFKKYRKLYISISGKENISEIVDDIYLSSLIKKFNSNDISLNTTKTILNNVSGIFFDKIPIGKDVGKNIGNIFKEINKNIDKLQNVFLIIDDVERISKKINIEDLLYSIYDKFISNNVKVLFICNEEVLMNNDEYNKIKEKIIRHIIKLHGTNSNNFFEFINTIKKDFIKSDDINQYFIYDGFFTDKLIPNICNIFVKMQCYNMRTFFKFIDMSKYFLSEINKYIENKDFYLNYNEGLFLEILKNFAFVLIKHDLNQDMELLSNDIILKKERSNDINVFSKDEKELYHKNYIEIIDIMKKLELNYNVSVFYFYKYILSGDISYFSKIAEAYKDYIYLDKEYLKALDVVRECNDGFDEIKKNADLIIEKMKNKKDYFSIKECWQIYILLFIRYKDLFIDEKDKYLQVIKDTLKFCWENVDYNSILETKNAYKSKDLNWHFIPVLIEMIYENNNNDILIKYESDLLNELTKNGKPIDEKIIIKLIEKFDSKYKDYFYNKISYEEKVLLFTDEVINNLPRTLFTINIYIMIFSDVVSVGICFDNYKTYYDNSIIDVDIIKRVLSFVDKIQTTDKYFIFKINELKDLLKAKYECTKKFINILYF